MREVTEIRITGNDLKNWRMSHKLYQIEVANKMSRWDWYRKKVQRLEQLGDTEINDHLCPGEMTELLKIMKNSGNF